MFIKIGCEKVGKKNERYESGLKPNLSHKPLTWKAGYSMCTCCGVSYDSCKGQISNTVKEEICKLEITGCMNNVKTSASALFV